MSCGLRKRPADELWTGYTSELLWRSLSLANCSALCEGIFSDMNNQRDAAVLGAPVGLGVRLTPNGQAYLVEIRPPKWSNENKPCKIWIGTIRDLGFARYIADAIFYYCGKERCYYGNENFFFPPLESLDLSTPEQRSTYVQGIAASRFRDRRQDFIDKVKKVLKGRDFILQGERFLRIAALADEEVAPVPPPPADEVAPVPAPLTDEAAPVDEHETPFEEDVDGVAMFSRFASSSQGASVATFGLNIGSAFDERILESVAQPLGFERYNPKDCPSVEDEDWDVAIKDWDMSIKELNKKSAVVVSTPHAVHIAAPVFENISFVPGTNFVDMLG